MSLPQEYTTPSFESLPEDLKARAEKIILAAHSKSVVKKATVKDKTFVANGVDPIAHVDFANIKETVAAINGNFIQEFTPIPTDDFFRGKKEYPMTQYRVRPIEVIYFWDGKQFSVETQCPNCRFVDRARYSESQLPSSRKSHVMPRHCMGCGSFMDVMIESRECWDAVHRSERDISRKSIDRTEAWIPPGGIRF